MDIGVRGGRKNGWVSKNKEFPFFGQILHSIDLMEEDEGGVKERLEEVGGDTLFEELSELSQHEELQDLEPHGGKMI